MDEELKNQIELEAHRIISTEAANYREHLEKQFSHLKWGLGIIVLAASAVFLFVSGKTYLEMNQNIKAQISDRLIDYMVKDEIKKRLPAAIQSVIQSVIQSDEIHNQIRQEVAKIINSEAGNIAVQKLNEAVDDKIKKLDVAHLDLLDTLPIGSIVPSVLPPDKFSNLLGETDLSLKKWVLADGTPVPNSAYAKEIGTTVPDLRGMFLRGLNVGRADGIEDPDGINRRPGDYQGDTLKKHSHVYNTAGIWARSFKGEDGDPRTAYFAQGNTQAAGDSETRPRNVAVFYYIKINYGAIKNS